jgi:hypothetical protein
MKIAWIAEESIRNSPGMPMYGVVSAKIKISRELVTGLVALHRFALF